MSKDNLPATPEDALPTKKETKPFAYKSKGNQWLKDIQNEAVNAEARLQLFAEIDLLRATLQELHDSCRVGGDGDERQVVKELLAISENLKDNVGDPEIIGQLNAKLDILLDHFERPLTEMSKGVPVEMCDATRMALTAKFADVIGKSTLNQHRMDLSNYIHRDYYVQYIREIHTITRELFRPTPEVESMWLDKVASLSEPQTGAKGDK